MGSGYGATARGAVRKARVACAPQIRRRQLLRCDRGGPLSWCTNAASTERIWGGIAVRARGGCAALHPFSIGLGPQMEGGKLKQLAREVGQQAHGVVA